MHELRSDSTVLWMWAGGLQALLSIWLVQSTQRVPSFTLLAVVAWGGAVICLEDQLEHLQLRPTRSSLLAGLLILVYASWRSAIVLDRDSSVYLLPLLQGLGLALMARPVRQLWIFKESLFILSLFPLQLLLTKVLPEYGLSVITALASQIILLVFGLNAVLSGRMLQLGEGSVIVGGPCNGVDLLAQLTVIAIVFVLAFPIRNTIWRILYVLAAPLMAFAVNAIRIAILAVVNSSALPNRQQLFDFLHDDWGGLLFAGVATLAMGQIYMILINRELADRHG